MVDWSTLYGQHVQQLQQEIGALMAQHQLNTLWFASGVPVTIRDDDQNYPFRSQFHFNRWLPLAHHPQCYLRFDLNDSKPHVIIYQPEDYWHGVPVMPEDFWQDHLMVEWVNTPYQLGNTSGQTAFVGDPTLAGPGMVVNPTALIHGLDWLRAYKTPYEQQCILQANVAALRGHAAAKQAFAGGASELAIHLAYLQASGQQESQTPYPNIVALDQQSAILHYDQKKMAHQTPDRAHSLLIDAGATCHGYSSDITRTWCSDPNHPFQEWIHDITGLQRQLIDQLTPGMDYDYYHQLMHQTLGQWMVDTDWCNLDPEEVVHSGLTRVFFPHGLGHLLGLQVHDVGGWQASILGGIKAPDRDHQNLRCTRQLAAGQTVTIEPGFYAIDALLKPWQGHQKLNWAKIEKLKKMGGIRIEDNVLITDQGAVNLTAQAQQQVDEGAG